MRILFDMVHPADALFFYHPIRMLKDRGIEVRVASRGKDVLINLLDELGIDHVPLTVARQGLFGQARELAERGITIFKLARSWKPDVMAGFGGIAISHAGKLLGIRSVSFYDTEHALLQLRLTLPFISEWHVPQSWNGPVAKGRTFRFRGSKQFAYLHPDYFRPDTALAEEAGWDPARENYLVRTVAWQASHDRGREGISSTRLRQVVERLSARGKVHISAEGELPPDLQPLQFRGRIRAFHHLLAQCRLYCGESITVASEAAALGVPSLLQIDKDYGYITEQEQAGLIRRFGPHDDVDMVVGDALREGPEEFRERSHRFVATAMDMNRYVVSALLAQGPSP